MLAYVSLGKRARISRTFHCDHTQKSCLLILQKSCRPHSGSDYINPFSPTTAFITLPTQPISVQLKSHADSFSPISAIINLPSQPVSVQLSHTQTHSFSPISAVITLPSQPISVQLSHTQTHSMQLILPPAYPTAKETETPPCACLQSSKQQKLSRGEQRFDGARIAVIKETVTVGRRLGR